MSVGLPALQLPPARPGGLLPALPASPAAAAVTRSQGTFSGAASKAHMRGADFVSTVLGQAAAKDSLVARAREEGFTLQPVPLAKLRNHSIDEVRGRRQPIEIPRDVADMYADLTAERERVTASMWELLVAYRRLVKALPERFHWPAFRSVMEQHADEHILDQRTFTACVQDKYRLPHGYIENEENELLRARKLAWKLQLEEVESKLLAMFPMMAQEVGNPPFLQRFLDVRDFRVCMYFLNEKEQPLHVIIARGARIYGFKPPGRKGEHVVSLRHFMRILTLPVFRNQARRDLAVSIVKAAQAGTVPFSDVAPLHFSESGVAMLLKASRLSTLLLPNKVASSLYCKVSNLEAMYAPALRAKLLRRKEKLGKLRSADLFFLRRRGRPLFQHWASLYQRRKRLATLLGNMERMVVHSWGRLSMRQWRDFLLQTQEAVRVQALFRGYRIRMAFYRASQARFIAQHISKARHWQIKAKYELQKAVEEELSAIVIQALVRGVVQRRRLLHKLLNRADPGTFAWRMKLRRDGTHQCHDSATVIQCAFRQFMARGIADRLWAARYEAEQAREADKAAMAEKQRRDRKAIQVVERMVAQRLEQRMAELTAQAQARETAAQVSTLQSKRQYAAKKRRMEEAAADVRKQHTQRMLEFNAEWDERHAKAVQETKEEWEGLILHKRPGDDEQDRQRSYDIARGEYMQIAKRLAAVHHNAVDLNVVEAKTEFIESKMAEAAAATAAKRKAARTRLAAELKRELASFRTERDQTRSMGNEVAASKICAFILQCRQRAAMRAILKEDWEKGYDLHRGAVFYVNRRTGTVKYKKPVFLGPTDVAIVDRWTVQHSEQGGLTFFFNPRTHALSWTQPKFTMLCPRCQADFVQFTCEEGCGDMCSACWTAAHPSHKEHLAIHSWAAKDGGRPIHYLSSWDANRMYAAAELGDDAFHGRPSVGDIDRFSRRERLAAAADSAIQEAALAASGAAQGDAEGAEQEDDGDLPNGIDVAGGRQPAVAFATGAALERVHVLEQHRASTREEGKDASYQGEAADALLAESGAEGKAGDGGEDVQDTGGHGLLDAVEPSPEPGPGHGAQEDSTAAHESYLAPDAFDGFEGPAAGGAAAAQGGDSAGQGEDWAGYDEYGGYYDEEGGYVDGEGGYTDVNGVYYPPE